MRELIATFRYIDYMEIGYVLQTKFNKLQICDKIMAKVF